MVFFPLKKNVIRARRITLSTGRIFFLTIILFRALSFDNSPEMLPTLRGRTLRYIATGFLRGAAITLRIRQMFLNTETDELFPAVT